MFYIYTNINTGISPVLVIKLDPDADSSEAFEIHVYITEADPAIWKLMKINTCKVQYRQKTRTFLNVFRA